MHRFALSTVNYTLLLITVWGLSLFPGSVSPQTLLNERIGIVPAEYQLPNGQWITAPGPYLELDGTLYIAAPRRRFLLQQAANSSKPRSAANNGSGLSPNAIDLQRQLAAGSIDLPVNNPTGQTLFSGNTQTNPSIAVNGDTVICVFSDSEGFFGLGESATGFACSVDDGLTWGDGGSLPLVGSVGSTEMLLGDASICTDGNGRWYCVSVYDIGNGAGSVGSGDLGLALSRGSFVAGVLQWSLPQVIALGPVPGSAFAFPDIAFDRTNDRLYVTYTNVSIPNLNGWGQVELVVLSNNATQLGTPKIVQVETLTINNAASRVAVGPNGELYCVWVSGLLGGGIDGQGPASVMIARSLDFGATFEPTIVVGEMIESWFSNPPGSNDENFNVDFPSIAVDRGPGSEQGRVYVSWHDGVKMVFATALDTISESSANNLIASATVLPDSSENWQINGSLSGGDTVDYFQFNGVAGEFFRGFVENTGGFTSFRLRLLCDSQNTAVADTVLAASARGTMMPVFCLVTLPYTGRYFIELRNSSFGGNYSASFRKTSVTLPSVAIDHRDIVVVSSPDGVSSWSSKVRVNDDTGPADQAWPSLQVDKWGVHVAWFDRRFDLGCRVQANTCLASSYDLGSTFGPNLRISSQSGSWQVPSDGTPNFGPMRMRAAKRSLYLPWTDGRTGDPDVRFSVLPSRIQLILPDSITALQGQALNLSIDVDNGIAAGDTIDVDVSSPWPLELPPQQFVLENVGALARATVLYNPMISPGIFNVTPCSLQVVMTSRLTGHQEVAKLRVVADGTVPVGVWDWSSSWAQNALHLTWRTDATNRFDVQRSLHHEGPFQTVSLRPVLDSGSGHYEFTDTRVIALEAYVYRLVGVDAQGVKSVHGPFFARAKSPARFRLLGAHPNPFNPNTEIRFEIAQASAVSLRILDARGRLVSSLMSARSYEPGVFSVRWDGTEKSGRSVASGVYLAELQSNGRRQVTRLILVR